MKEITLMDLMLYTLVNGVYIYAIDCYFDAYFHTKKACCKKCHIPVLVVYLAVVQYSFFWGNDIAVNFAVNIVFMFAVTMLYHSKFVNKLFAIAIVYSLAMVCESLTVALFALSDRRSVQEIMQNAALLLFLVIASKLIFLVLVKILRPLLHRTSQGRNETLPLVYWVGVLLIPIFSIYIIHVLSTNCIDSLQSPQTALAMALILTINLLTFTLYEKLMKNSAMKLENLLLSQKIDHYEEHFNQMQRTQSTILALKHDMKNQLIGMIGCLQPENQQAAIQAREQLEQILGEIKGAGHQLCSGFPSIDAIINYKTAYAQEDGTSLVAKVELSDSLHIDQRAISIILGNILDNAIESCRKMEPNARQISLVVCEQNKNLYIQIKNPLAGELRLDEKGFPISTKLNADAHGIGLKSVQSVVRELDGIMKFYWESGFFKLEILLFCKENNL